MLWSRRLLASGNAPAHCNHRFIASALGYAQRHSRSKTALLRPVVRNALAGRGSCLFNTGGERQRDGATFLPGCMLLVSAASWTDSDASMLLSTVFSSLGSILQRRRSLYGVLMASNRIFNHASAWQTRSYVHAGPQLWFILQRIMVPLSLLTVLTLRREGIFIDGPIVWQCGARSRSRSFRLSISYGMVIAAYLAFNLPLLRTCHASVSSAKFENRI